MSESTNDESRKEETTRLYALTDGQRPRGQAPRYPPCSADEEEITIEQLQDKLEVANNTKLKE